MAPNHHDQSWHASRTPRVQSWHAARPFNWIGYEGRRGAEHKNVSKSWKDKIYLICFFNKQCCHSPLIFDSCSQSQALINKLEDPYPQGVHFEMRILSYISFKREKGQKKKCTILYASNDRSISCMETSLHHNMHKLPGLAKEYRRKINPNPT